MKKIFLFFVLVNVCASANAQVTSSIFGFKNGDILNNEIVNKRNVNEIARLLVDRLNREQNLPQTTPLYDFRKDTTVLIQFDEQYIRSISRNCFKNLHQVKHSGGSTNKLDRARVEDYLIGLKLEEKYQTGKSNIINSLRPKYGYVMLDKLNHRDEQTSYLPQYGNIFAVLKDDVKDRSTFTSDDSLDDYLQGGRNPTYTFKELPFVSVGAYYEAQIWGETCFSDVDHFLINCPGMELVSSKRKKLLKKQGIPVFECSKDSKKRLRKVLEEVSTKNN